MTKPVTFFANFPVNKHPLTFEVIRRYRNIYERNTYEGCDLVPLNTSSIGDSEQIIHFQEAYARLFLHCYNKQGIQSNLHSYTPMNQGTICEKVYLEGIQQIKGNNCGLIPIESVSEGFPTYFCLNLLHCIYIAKNLKDFFFCICSIADFLRYTISVFIFHTWLS